LGTDFLFIRNISYKVVGISLMAIAFICGDVLSLWKGSVVLMMSLSVISQIQKDKSNTEPYINTFHINE